MLEDDGYDSPEEAALAGMSDIPEPYRRLVGVHYSEDGETAVVEFLTNETPYLYPYYVECGRDERGRWSEYASHN